MTKDLTREDIFFLNHAVFSISALEEKKQTKNQTKTKPKKPL